jgi:NAD-dependent deacetylase
MICVDTSVDSLIARAAELLYAARYAIALTGAGVSVPSGIPDFRSPGSGLWEQVDPMAVASVTAFRYQPEAFFEWIRPLAFKLLAAQPNPAHTALADLEAMGGLKAIITQNIDGLHQQAGSQRVLEVHGHMREAICIRCYTVFPSEQFVQAVITRGQVPRCPRCNGILKPNVILLGEQLPAQVVLQAQQEIQKCDLVLVAGSSLEVTPVAEWPAWARYRRGARVMIVNLQPTHLDGEADLVLQADVAEALPRISAAYRTLIERGHE